MLPYNSLLILILYTLVNANIHDSVGTTSEHLQRHDAVPQEDIGSLMYKPKEDLFSSISKLEELVSNELQIVDLLDTFASYTLEKAELIKSYVEGQKRLLMNGKKSKDIVAHPVEAYVLVRRLTAEWDEVHMALHGLSNYTTGVANWIDAHRERSNFPGIEDLHGAAQAIVRLQDTYKLDIDSLSGGSVSLPDVITNEIIKEFHGTQPLNARDLLFFGKHALKQGMFSRAVQWLQKSQEVASGAMDEINSKLLLDEIEGSLRSAIEVNGDIMKRQVLPADPGTTTQDLAKNNDNTASMKKDDFVPKLFQRQTEEEELEHYVRLCRGERLRESTLDTNLKCRTKRSGHPYFTIAPLKLEVASQNPYIVIIHDFITHNQSDHLIELGKPKLLRSKHRHYGAGATDIASTKRISQNAWIRDWEFPYLKSITHRVHEVTGLKATEPSEAEDYQIANYGLGGLYVPHTDYLMNHPDPNSYTPWEWFIGDRVATLMIYLSDVNSGGATVFPRAGVSLWPEKGSAAFWWNLDRSGTGDEDTRHGACPVLHGDKWVSNKWIRYNEQFLTATCGRRPSDKFRRP